MVIGNAIDCVRRRVDVDPVGLNRIEVREIVR